MSLRGIKFQFEAGEPVICFEPDPTKARVLYNAKVLELIVGRGGDGTRQAEYLVHFQGWNSSWDRIVPETFILGNTDDNKQLMKLIACAARKIKTNRSRKRKIENLLRRHFRGHPDFVENASDDTEESDESDSDEESDSDMDPEYADCAKDDSSDQEVSFRDRTLVNGGDETCELSQTEPEDQLEEVDPEKREVDLELPENLKRKLEDDCYNICRKDKLVQLPASPNVITVLEGYVKTFTANLMYSTVEKKLPRRERRGRPLPKKNIELVKEVVDGLRVFFDFTLPSILLYREEKEQFKQVINNYIHTAVSTKQFEMEQKPPLKIEVEEVTSPRLRSSAAKTSSQPPHFSSTPLAPHSSGSPLAPHSSSCQGSPPPCSSPTVSSSVSPKGSRQPGTWATKHQVCEENILDVEETTTSPTRRLTRNIFCDFSRKRGISDSRSDTNEAVSCAKVPRIENGKCVTVSVDLGEEASTHQDSSRRVSLRSSGGGIRHASGDVVTSSSTARTSRRSAGTGDHGLIADDEGAANLPSLTATSSKEGGSLLDRLVPPPPLNMAAVNMSSKDSTTSSQNTPNPSSDSSSSMIFCNGYKTKEAALNHIYGWSLIPEEVYQSSPTPPSVVYGAHHLLRLFVKLPKLLGQMAIQENNYENLIEHLDMFIDYMSERSEDLFPDTVYVDVK